MKTPAINNDMGRRVYMRMVELGMNMKQLSIEAGLNETYVRDLLKDEDPNPRLKHLRALATALKVSLEWIENGRGVGQIDPGLQDVIDWWGDIPEDRQKFLTETADAMRQRELTGAEFDEETGRGN